MFSPPPSTHTHIRQYSNIIIYRHYDIKSGRGHLYFLYGLFSLFMVEEFLEISIITSENETHSVAARIKNEFTNLDKMVNLVVSGESSI